MGIFSGVLSALMYYSTFVSIFNAVGISWVNLAIPIACSTGQVFAFFFWCLSVDVGNHFGHLSDFCLSQNFHIFLRPLDDGVCCDMVDV